MSYPKVIFGPFSVMTDSKPRMLRVELHTNGDWRGTDEGQAELERVGSVLVNSLDKFPRNSQVQLENDDWLYLKIPCAENETYRWMEELKKTLPKLTGAVYNNIGVAPDR